MQFCKLSLDNHNILNFEIEEIYNKHRMLMEDIDKESKQETIKEMYFFQEKLKKRSQDIKEFIERYSFDSRITYFIKANKLLIRLLEAYRVKSNFPQEHIVEKKTKRINKTKILEGETARYQSSYQLKHEKDNDFNQLTEIKFKIILTRNEYEYLNEVKSTYKEGEKKEE